MNQCVPSWDVDENPLSPRFNSRAQSKSNSLTIDVPTMDYEVAELTWENGQLAMHGLGLPRVPNKTTTTASSSPTKYTWEKPRVGGTLESIVNQATGLPHPKSAIRAGRSGAGDELVPWFAVPSTASGCSASINTGAGLVPCTHTHTDIKNAHRHSTHVVETVPGFDTPARASSTRVESCSGVPDVNPARAAQEWSSRADHSGSNSATTGTDSHQVTFDTCERDLGTVGFTSTSMGSPENTSSAKQWSKTADDHDSVCHDRSRAEVGDENDKKKGKSSTSTKRSRAAAVHNQSERKRRDRINQRMKTLQKLIPNSSKTDKASMLDEVIEYLKQLQAQVQMMSRVNMMLPMAMQQQLQMSMMAAPMGMAGMAAASMGMAGMGAGIPGISPVLHPGAFMHMASWDGNGDRLPTSISAMPHDPLSAFLACQSQPMTMDAYSRIASLYQQFHQQPGPGSKN